METPQVSTAPQIIYHYKEVHSFYIFVAIICFGIIILQPISMVLLIITQSMLQ